MQHQTLLKGSFAISPIDLLADAAKVNLPWHNGYVPLFIIDRKFPSIAPQLEALGAGAVEMSLANNTPFGFTYRIDGNGNTVPGRTTQQTRSIILAADPQIAAKGWRMTMDTPKSLSKLDESAFREGLGYYVNLATRRFLNAQRRTP